MKHFIRFMQPAFIKMTARGARLKIELTRSPAEIIVAENRQNPLVHGQIGFIARDVPGGTNSSPLTLIFLIMLTGAAGCKLFRILAVLPQSRMPRKRNVCPRLLKIPCAKMSGMMFLRPNQRYSIAKAKPPAPVISAPCMP